MPTTEKQQKPGQQQLQASTAFALSKYMLAFTLKAGSHQEQTTGVPKTHLKDVLLETDLSLNPNLNNWGTNSSPRPASANLEHQVNLPHIQHNRRHRRAFLRRAGQQGLGELTQLLTCVTAAGWWKIIEEQRASFSWSTRKRQEQLNTFVPLRE